MTIAEQLSEDSRFSTFLQLVDEVNITMFLDVAGGKSRTVFAPTNDAFDELSEGVVECLQQPENINSLRSLLLTHISSPAQYSTTLSQQSKLSTFNIHYRRHRVRTYHLRVTVNDGEIFLTSDLIPLEESDISANNGVIHACLETDGCNSIEPFLVGAAQMGHPILDVDRMRRAFTSSPFHILVCPLLADNQGRWWCLQVWTARESV